MDCPNSLETSEAVARLVPERAAAGSHTAPCANLALLRLSQPLLHASGSDDVYEGFDGRLRLQDRHFLVEEPPGKAGRIVPVIRGSGDDCLTRWRRSLHGLQTTMDFVRATYDVLA